LFRRARFFSFVQRLEIARRGGEKQRGLSQSSAKKVERCSERVKVSACTMLYLIDIRFLLGKLS